MKKIFAFLILLTSMTSCYDEYLKDFDYNGVYFTYQVTVRTLVVGEGMKIQIGVVLGGIRENDRDRVVEFQLDNSLISTETLAAMKSSTYSYIKNAMTTVTELKALPSDYYNLSDISKFIIMKGRNSGVITLKTDSTAFLSDTTTILPAYVLPFRITGAEADTVITSKNYSVIAIKYENMLFGNYWHGGVTTEKDGSGNIINEIKYYTAIPSPDSKAWALTTIGPSSLATNGVSDQSSSSKKEFMITLNGGNITISSMPGATFEVLPDGTSTYNQAKLLQNREIYLSYKYQNTAGNWCYATDTLTFRNRIRDGVNEWQDENPSHY
jgi:hypothetical protein